MKTVTVGSGEMGEMASDRREEVHYRAQIHELYRTLFADDYNDPTSVKRKSSFNPPKRVITGTLRYKRRMWF